MVASGRAIDVQIESPADFEAGSLEGPGCVGCPVILLSCPCSPTKICLDRYCPLFPDIKRSIGHTIETR